MKDAIWVFKSFGFKAGVLFVLGAIAVRFKRLIGKAKKPKKFEELSDKEAREVAQAFGLSPWQNRATLDDQFNHINEDRTLH